MADFFILSIITNLVYKCETNIINKNKKYVIIVVEITRGDFIPAYDKTIISFYKSSKWLKARQIKLLKQRGICERCGKRGTEVHHKIYLSPSNVNDASISLSLDNLELLCKACHNAEHDRYSKQIRKDLMFDKNGNMFLKDTPHYKKIN